MEQLHNGITLMLCDGAFPLSTDSMLLAGFTRLTGKATVLDLGSGCGTLGLLLCAQHPDCHVTGVEIDESNHATALENIRRNQLSARLESICMDLAEIPNRFSPGSFSCCISNPPYFSAGPASSTVPLARREDSCPMSALLRSAAWTIKFGGDFFLVHRPERLAELFACAVAVKLEPKRLCLVRHRKESPVSLVLVQCRKGAKPGLIWEELCLFDESGQPTEDYRKIYHL